MPNAFDITSNQIVLIVHAHPDDESMACAGAIEQLVRDGIMVYTVTATDGEQSTRGDRQFVANGQRRGEAQAALQLLGIPLARQHYFGLPDGELTAKQTELARLLHDFCIEHNVSVVITPGASGFDGHADHIAAHQAAVAACQTLATNGKHLTVWALASDGDGQAVVPVDFDHKLAALAMHHSQFPMSSAAGALVVPNATQQYLDHYTYLLHTAETYNCIADSPTTKY